MSDMNKPPTTLMVALSDSAVCLKISGKASFTNSLDFKNVVNELVNRGYCRFILDLADCTMMDSTFLGVLAGVGLKFTQQNGEPNGSVELLNPTQRITDLLENLGVVHLFKITHASAPAGDFKAVEEKRADRTDVTRTCLEAHRTLMGINPENIRKFKDVTEFLAEDLKKLEREQQKTA